MIRAANLVAALASGRKASQLYPKTHPAFVEALETLLSSAATLTAEKTFTLNLHKGHLYQDSTVIPDDAPGVRSIIEALEQRKIESITLHAGFQSQDAIALIDVLGLRPSPDLNIEGELALRGAVHVSIAHIADDEDKERKERDLVREKNLELHRRLVGLMNSMIEESVRLGSVDTGNIDRSVEEMTARLLENRGAILGLATQGKAGNDHMHHALAVMIYSLALGATLGLPPEGLSALGSAALLHDIGKTSPRIKETLPIESIYLAHPQLGAELLARHAEKDPSLMLVAYEHHMHVDGGGFPEAPSGYIPHPYSRIVAIANRYANLTAPGVSGDPQTPDQALLSIVREAGTMFDPHYAKLFAKAMGVFPVGCIVRLTDHSVGVVTEPGPDPLLPKLLMIYGPDGIALEPPYSLELSDDTLSIVEIVASENLGLTVADYL